MRYTINTKRLGKNGLVEVIDTKDGVVIDRDQGYIGKTTDCHYAQVWSEAVVLADTLNYNEEMTKALEGGCTIPEAQALAAESLPMVEYEPLPF